MIDFLGYSWDVSAIAAFFAALTALAAAFFSYRTSVEANKISKLNLHLEAAIEVFKVEEKRHAVISDEFANFMANANPVHLTQENKTETVKAYNKLCVLMDNSNPHYTRVRLALINALPEATKSLDKNDARDMSLNEFELAISEYLEADWQKMNIKLENIKNAKNK